MRALMLFVRALTPFLQLLLLSELTLAALPPPDTVPDTVTERGLTRTKISARDSSDNATVSNFNYTVLWNNTPSWMDLQQVKVLDCWLVAASLAVVITSPSWVENMYYFPNGSSMANLSYPSSDLAVVTVFDPTSYVAHNFTTTIANESTTEDDPGGVWWHSAMTQALQLLGTVTYVDGITSSGGIDPNGGSGYLALSALTGYPAIRRATTNYTSSDEFFSDCSKGYWTPVVLSTCGSVGTTTPYQIGANHDYAVMYTNDHGNGNRTVTLRNPWGRTEWYDLEDLMANIYGLGHLTDWNYLSWPGT